MRAEGAVPVLSRVLWPVVLLSCAAPKPPAESTVGEPPSPVPTASPETEAKPASDGGSPATATTPSASVTPSARTFKPEEVRRVVMLRMHEIRKCYEASLAVVPALAGTVTLGWHISATGVVTRASVLSSTMKYAPVEECFVKAVRGWVFQNPDAVEADASWGFKFTPP